jgi:4-amino-4-deoxy-L-arabinose transferase-like glycosyltransferase
MKPRSAGSLLLALLPYPLFALLVFLLRIYTFPAASLDMDEGFYRVTAHSLLQGSVLYVDFWDHKPPGIFVLFALAERIFGAPTAAPRVLACLFVAASAFLLYRFGRDRLGSAGLGWMAGYLYAVFSIRSNGDAANTELFLAPFVILGAYLLAGSLPLSPGAELPWRTLLMAGLSFGFAIQINYVTGAQLAVPAAWILFLAGPLRDGLAGRRSFGALLLVLLAAFLPFAAPLLYFWQAGHLREYWYANFTANFFYVSDKSLPFWTFRRGVEHSLLETFLPWSAVLLSPFLVPWRGRENGSYRRSFMRLSAWLGAAGLGVFASRNFFNHYFLQFLPPLCLLTALILVRGAHAWGIPDRRRRVTVLAFLLLLGTFGPLYYPVRAGLKTIFAPADTEETDTPRKIARYLRERIDRGAYLYVVDYEPILYYLAGARCPTPYAFQTFLLDPHSVRVAGVDPGRELESIMRRRPEYVVRTQGEPQTPYYLKLYEHLGAEYVLETEINGVRLYRLRSPGIS